MKTSFNFCALFDKGFLLKGLALHDSLLERAGNFTLWILCMDEETYFVLEKLNLPNVRLLALSDIEDAELKAARQNRSPRKYCFTLSPSLPLYILKNNDMDNIAYLDADLYFFASPKVIYEEMGNNSIMIIPHHLGPSRKEKEKEVGKYNVGMLIFKKDERGLACLEWWKGQCLLYCDDEPKPGHYDDQKFLDYFEEKFKGVHALKNRGADLAPWNIERENIRSQKGTIFVGSDTLVFFHFSGFALYPQSPILPYGPYSFHEYIRSSLLKDLIYRPYAETLYEMLKKVRVIEPDWNYGLRERPGFLKSAGEFFNNSFYFPARRLAKILLSPLIKMLK